VSNVQYQQKYVQALLREIEHCTNAYYNTMHMHKPCVDTIYFGGGTPSCLYIGGIATILQALRDKVDVVQDAEITVECNPESVTHDKMIEYKRAGVNRISMGLQCADDDILKLLGRKHTTNDYVEATKIVREYFDNYSTDLILGLPKARQEQDLVDIVNKSMDIALSCNLQHMSVYALKVEDGTPLMHMQAGMKMPDDDTVADMYDMVTTRLHNSGLYRYEISNYSIKGYESRHNLKYWQGGDYYGFGVSASGRHGNQHTRNTDDIDEYINARPCDIETVAPATLANDYVMLGLRLSEGIDINEYRARFGTDILIDKRDAIDKLIQRGLIVVQDSHMYIPQQYMYTSNSIILQLI
jgi:oxygen-independent coproporphyrinogen-3 oxidase